MRCSDQGASRAESSDLIIKRTLEVTLNQESSNMITKHTLEVTMMLMCAKRFLF